jgi:hypothetical protein
MKLKDALKLRPFKLHHHYLLFWNQLFFKGDELAQSSAGIAMDQPITETDALKFADGFQGRNNAIQEKITGILMSDVFVSDPMAKIASQGAKKEQIKNLLEREKDMRERMAEMIAENKAFNAHERAKTRQLQKMWAAEPGSSQGTSDDKADSIAQIESAYLVGPQDLGVG